jgi:hypothetical protein
MLCEQTLLISNRRSTADNVLGFLLVGINPHKRYDEDYTLFIELLSRQLATAMAVSTLFSLFTDIMN